LAAIILFSGVLCVNYTVQAYPEIFDVKVNMDKDQAENVHPNDFVRISFSQPVLIGSYEQKITVTPNIKLDFSWGKNNTELIVRPNNFWDPGTTYQFNLPEGRSVMLTAIEKQNFSFSTIPYPKVEKFYPEPDQKNVVLDIEDPIVIDLDRSAKGFDITVVSRPDAPMIIQSNPEKSQLKLLPSQPLQRGQKYEVKIYANYSDHTSNHAKQIYDTAFETLPAVPQTGTQDSALIVKQAKSYTVPKINEGKYIDVNLANQVMTVFENGKALEAFRISSGQRGMETPVGKTKIYNKARRAYSKKYGLFMPYWMAITADGSRGLHELPEWPNGYKEGMNHLGIPVSHGCVRLGVGAAEFVYNWADIGTTVVIY
jgi:lipoprotein-anchoring transpeptidase ErfK/SrfK